jgi:hypothetical protein
MYFLFKNEYGALHLGIPRWWLEGGSRKRDSYSEILEKHWRHTFQARPLRRGKTLKVYKLLTF